MMSNREGATAGINPSENFPNFVLKNRSIFRWDKIKKYYNEQICKFGSLQSSKFKKLFKIFFSKNFFLCSDWPLRIYPPPSSPRSQRLSIQIWATSAARRSCSWFSSTTADANWNNRTNPCLWRFAWAIHRSLEDFSFLWTSTSNALFVPWRLCW